MSEPTPDKPARRPRYRGRNPRHFSEKYKEHAADLYPDDVAKVLASGKTPAGSHRSIMVQEILQCLAPRPGEVAVDCTLGFGGHARELLKAIQPGGMLIGLDVDSAELPRTQSRLQELNFPDEAVHLERSNFAGLSKVLAKLQLQGVDLVLADLGVSSMQIDDPARGFTFKTDGPLDMRMNPGKGISAAEFLNRTTPQKLARCFSENADEPQADFLAGEILRTQSVSPILTTKGLADLIRTACSRYSRGNRDIEDATVRRVFQAIRIAVNDEFGSLDALLRQLPTCLNPGGRVAILSFHSGEDRRVKLHLKEGLRSGLYSKISEEVIQAGPEERRSNPRSASAKLRYGVRVEG